jgi:hypothetical protein
LHENLACALAEVTNDVAGHLNAAAAHAFGAAAAHQVAGAIAGSARYLVRPSIVTSCVARRAVGHVCEARREDGQVFDRLDSHFKIITKFVYSSSLARFQRKPGKSEKSSFRGARLILVRTLQLATIGTCGARFRGMSSLLAKDWEHRVGTSDTERRTKKHVVLDGVSYDITVSIVSDGIYRADWTCSECGEEGAWSPLSGDPIQAVELAKVGLEVHHAFLHRGLAVRRLAR